MNSAEAPILPATSATARAVTASERARVLLIGTGGHALVCLEALLDDPSMIVVGAVSRDGARAPTLNVEVIATDSDLVVATQSVRATTAFVAIGDNTARAAVARRWLETGLPLATAVSRFAMVSRSATIGSGAALLPGAVINAATTIGVGAIVNTNASVDHECVIGDFVHIAPGSAVGGNVSVGTGALIGIGARVLPGVTVGAHAIVGGGATVIADVGPGTVVAGVPARVLGTSRPGDDG